MKKLILIALALFALTCAKINKGLFDGSDANGVPDTTAPVPGGSGTLTVTGLSGTALTLNWTGASDNGTQTPSLEYIVYQSSASNIDTIQNAEANGTPIGSYTAGSTALNITGLTPSTTYYFNVVVRDAAGNKAAYTMLMQTTGSGVDTTPPVAGNAGIIMVSGVGANALTLDWAAATDDTTVPASLQYIVYQSAMPNVDTVANAEVNGTALGSYTAALATLNVGSLAPATTYYFNVVAMDAAGNKTAYQMVSQATSSTPDTTVPTPGSGGVITTSAITASGLTLNWTQGTDDTTAPGALEYLAYVSLNMDVDTVANTEANGTAIGSYATAISTVNATALTASTFYCFNVIVRDAAGNKTAYQMVCDTTGGAMTTGTQLPQTDGSIYTMVQNGNFLYVGGQFTSIDGQSRSNIASIDITTNTVTAWDPNADNEVTSLTVSGSTIYVTGYFSNIGGQARQNIAALDTTTGLATGWNPNLNSTSSANALALSGSTVYVGGDFTNIGGKPRNYLAALDGTTGLAMAGTPGVDNPVSTLAVAGSTIYAGGDFTIMGFAARGGTVLNAVTGIPSEPYTDGSVFAAATDGAGGWYIGGSFGTVGGVVRNNIARINADGSLHPWNPNANSKVYAIAVSGSTVYVGGNFGLIGGQTRNQIAAIDSTTGLATTWNPNASNQVLSLAVSGSTVYAGGSFVSIGGQTRFRIAALDATTGLATAWNPNSATGDVSSIVVSGSTVYAGGNFTNIGGQARNHIGALDATTGLATTWNPNANGSVSALAVSGSTIYAGGAFTSIGGQMRNNIAALDTTTGLATAWNPNANGSVSALAVSGSTIYAGGAFTSIGGQMRNNIAALDTTTGLATTWNPNASDQVLSLAVSGSTIYAGGYFNYIGWQNRNFNAAFDTTTGGVTAWNPNPDTKPSALAAAGSAVYAGGNFTSIGGQGRSNLAALDATTGNATLWNPNVDNSVTMLTSAGSVIYIGGGAFSSIGGTARQYLAAIDATAGNTTAWNPSPDNQITAMTTSGTTVYVAGTFTTIGGQSCVQLCAIPQ